MLNVGLCAGLAWGSQIWGAVGHGKDCDYCRLGLRRGGPKYANTKLENHSKTSVSHRGSANWWLLISFPRFGCPARVASVGKREFSLV
jgi:hypothetical protein